ncbi:hypothetical protein DWG14_08368 [Streptomyces griseorubiginosus]|uniref:Uncharacterized protein n=1 Tax=Streptomyces griseorubiginosus TaxID=67304 RepID=A0AAI8PT97_9ACTN|nr:hypothetical protein DWG14_08368 [Streptomyces griseorubiginosus]
MGPVTDRSGGRAGGRVDRPTGIRLQPPARSPAERRCRGRPDGDHRARGRADGVPDRRNVAGRGRRRRRRGRHPRSVRGLFTLCGFARPRTTHWLVWTRGHPCRCARSTVAASDAASHRVREGTRTVWCLGPPPGHPLAVKCSPDQTHSFCQTGRCAAPARPGVRFAHGVPRWPEWVPGLSAVRAVPIERSFEVWLDGHRFEMFAGERVSYTRLGWSDVDAGGGSTRRGCSLR